MGFKDKKEKFMLLFKWVPVAVSEPIELYEERGKNGVVLAGYEVTVTFKHQGKKEYFFATDEGKFFLFPRKWALGRATRFSNSIKKRIQNAPKTR